MGGIQHTHSNDTGHAISACLYNYTNDLITLVSTVLQFSWKIYAIILISFSAAIFFHSKSDKKNSWLNLILFLLFIRMAEKCYRDKLLFSGGYLFVHVLMQFYLAWFFLLIFTLILSAYYNKELIQPIIKNNKFHFSILAILLLSLPFISAIGTNNPIMQNTIMCMVSWFALLEVLFALLAYLQNNQGIYWVGTLIIAFFAGSQIISASLSPYRLNTDIFKQNISTTIGVPATNVQLDLATSNFFKAVQKIAISHGFKPGDDILAFTDMPGIVFALGGKSPVIAGFTSTPNAVNVDTQLMELIAPTRLKQAFILENGRLGFPQLSKFNIKFPQDYKLCGEVMWPLTKEWVRLWQPKYRQENNLQ